jgi:hypothetical protein
MSNKKISYLSRTFDDYKESLKTYTEQYYPEIANDFNDSSVGSWMVDLVSAVADNLSYYIDRAYNETNLDSAQSKSSVYALARSNGFKVPGPKASMTEVKFSCSLPVSSSVANSSSTNGMPSWSYAPVIKKGTRIKSNSGQYFETTEDLDFTLQFDENGVSNRTITPITDSNNIVKRYIVTKTCTATAGYTKTYKMAITSSKITPFMEITIPEKNVMNVDSIIFKDGANFQSDPLTSEFMQQAEFISAEDSISGVDTYRFFEVDSLLQQYRWGDDISTTSSGNQEVGESKTYEYGYYVSQKGVNVPSYSITKGQWIPLTQKFITEYTNNGYMKVIFGSGDEVGQDVDIDKAGDFTKNQITRMIRNNFLGKLPKEGTTMYISYRVGGGAASNVATGTITTISKLDASNKTCPVTSEDKKVADAILSSITVTNTIPSVSGKDAPSVEEIRNMIKYNNAAQERCVTVKDYISRILKMPPRYGCPFRVGALEENNKVMIYLMFTDNLGQLSDVLPSQLVENIQNYLSHYRSINDFVEIKSGRIVNLSFEADLYVDKNYNSGEVVKSVINTIKSYMDINNHDLGKDIYVSDIQKEITNVDGVLNLIDLRVYNEFGTGYSQTKISQQTVYLTEDDYGYDKTEDSERSEVDLNASDYILNSEADEMFEIKNDTDIRIRVKTR